MLLDSIFLLYFFWRLLSDFNIFFEWFNNTFILLLQTLLNLLNSFLNLKTNHCYFLLNVKNVLLKLFNFLSTRFMNICFKHRTNYLLRLGIFTVWYRILIIGMRIVNCTADFTKFYLGLGLFIIFNDFLLALDYLLILYIYCSFILKTFNLFIFFLYNLIKIFQLGLKNTNLLCKCCDNFFILCLTLANWLILYS